MTEDMLIDLIDKFIGQWVDEEMELNGDTVSREQRLEETRSTFLEALTFAWIAWEEEKE
tara:strand:+ start:658 stop:834 length:177 start_codon:yes stop_codon:yes gene_type:complete